MMKHFIFNSSLKASLLIAWLVLSPIAFFGEFNKVHEKVSPDGNYKAIAYTVLPTTPISFYQFIINDAVFIVLFDKNENYLGQSSPFYFSGIEGLLYEKVFFPGEIQGENSFSVNGINDYTEGYTIPVNQKRWWSWILEVFH
ncbi:hypothetical protein JK232_21190 [Nissabacter archeti]|uniref:Uncharacterized protein n=1 Tax=Nissabacter archeti TaxID=1917880 RepID=A0ABS5JPW8_9GAMM|nr:DUF6201 family protein [Nissabacter archeti]MBS0971403.1 hypothetical protein [Nissabacter archeti]